MLVLVPHVGRLEAAFQVLKEGKYFDQFFLKVHNFLKDVSCQIIKSGVPFLQVSYNLPLPINNRFAEFISFYDNE